jgi:uncharacterized membrane protein
MLSFEAAYASPIIMMSQNRQAAKDRLQAELDLQTDLKAEALIEEVHGSVETLRLLRRGRRHGGPPRSFTTPSQRDARGRGGALFPRSWA